MKKMIFQVQSFGGGPVVEFDLRPSTQFSAERAMRNDRQLAALTGSDRNFVKGVVKCIQSAQANSEVADAIDVPGEVTFDSVMAFMDAYAVGAQDDVDIPTGDDAEDASANPTDTQVASS